MFAGLSPVVPGVGVCGWILELCGVELQAQPLRNTLEKCQGQEMFPKSLHSQLTDKLPFPVPAPLMPQAVKASGMQSSRCGTVWGNSKTPNQEPGLGRPPVRLSSTCPVNELRNWAQAQADGRVAKATNK